MEKFQFGYPNLDKHLQFKPNSLIVIGSRLCMGNTSFAINVLLRNTSKKGCYLNLKIPKNKFHEKLAVISKGYAIANKMKPLIDIPIQKNENFEVVSLLMPTILELLELLGQKKEADYFIIDELKNVDYKTKLLFSNDKNYESILRFLNVFCEASNKTIVLLATTHHKVENSKKHEFNFRYYARYEKYANHIFCLHRPNFYMYDFPIEEGNEEVFIYLAKTTLSLYEEKFSLDYDSKHQLFL
ncbi:hypothetical protein ACFLSU_02120 [Bacteroidota bacterium]